MAKEKTRMYAGADWIEGNLFPGENRLPKLPEFGAMVADLLGDLYQGIYHLSTTSLRATEWHNLAWIEICVPDELATFDGDRLTMLVILAHERHIRVSVSGASNKYLRLIFHPRKRDGGFTERHPTIEAAIETCRVRYGKGGP